MTLEDLDELIVLSLLNSFGWPDNPETRRLLDKLSDIIEEEE